MRAEEAEKLKDEIWHAANRKGIPINVRVGANLEAADWIMGVLEKHIQVDEPLGVVEGNDYDRCPVCSGIIGQSAYFCKKCGAYVRQVRK